MWRRRAERQAEPPDWPPADAPARRSPNAARLKRRIPTGKLVPRQACPKYARVVQTRAGSNLQAVDTTTGGNRWRYSKSADRKVMGVRPPSRHHSKIFKTYNLNVFSCECLLQGLSQWNSHRDRFVTLLCLGGFLALL